MEAVDLGNLRILDTRRFNDELVVYGALVLDPPAIASKGTAGGAAPAVADQPITSGDARDHRTLRVFHIGATLEPRMNDTLFDDRKAEAQLVRELDPNTPVAPRCRAGSGTTPPCGRATTTLP